MASLIQLPTPKTRARRRFQTHEPVLLTDWQLHVAQRLSATLDPAEVLAHYQHELNSLVSVHHLKYLHDGTAVVLGEAAEHVTKYALHAEGENLGELTLSRATPFSDADQALIERTLALLHVPLRNALRYQAALALADVDALTGCLNRRALDRTLPREVDLARRYGHPLSVMMIDLDRFKAINDNFGHDAGDRVLQVTARVMRECLRTSDLVYRYGGEEFIVLLPHTHDACVQLVGERLRRALSGLGIDKDGAHIAISASIGLAALGASDGPNALLARADAAMYQAKQAGGDRCQFLAH